MQTHYHKKGHFNHQFILMALVWFGGRYFSKQNMCIKCTDQHGLFLIFYPGNWTRYKSYCCNPALDEWFWKMFQMAWMVCDPNCRSSALNTANTLTKHIFLDMACENWSKHPKSSHCHSNQEWHIVPYQSRKWKETLADMQMVHKLLGSWFSKNIYCKWYVVQWPGLRWCLQFTIQRDKGRRLKGREHRPELFSQSYLKVCVTPWS